MKRSIIVWKDKHGTLYYAADNEMEMYYAYKSIFTKMLKSGYYKDMEVVEREINDLKKELDNLSITDSKDRIKEIEKSISYKEYNLNLFVSAKDGNVKSMKQFIRDRSDRENEMVYNDYVEYPSKY